MSFLICVWSKIACLQTCFFGDIDIQGPGQDHADPLALQAGMAAHSFLDSARL